jgi:hypothetical protein
VLPEGGVAQIVEMDETSKLVLATTPDGREIDRPLSFVEARWKPIGASSILVRRATDSVGVMRQAGDDPVGLIVAAIEDHGGRASLADIRLTLTPTPFSIEEFERWWKNAQRRLADDGRVDVSYARDGEYRLGSALGRRSSAEDSPFSDEVRLGRRLANGRLMARARALTSERREVAPEDRRLVQQEAELYRTADLDPTDRYLSFELAIRIGSAKPHEAGAALGDDLLQVDLTRVRDKASRALALQLARSWPETSADATQARAGSLARPLLASAATADEALEAPALALAELIGAPSDLVFAGRMGWGIPGAPESGQVKYPDELQAVERRVTRWDPLDRIADRIERRATAAGALDALQVLQPTEAHHILFRRVMDRLARIAWQAGANHESIALIGSRRGSLRPEAVSALLRTATTDALPGLRDAVKDWYRSDPERFRAVLLDFAERAQVDPVSVVLEGAHDEIRETTAPRLAAAAFDLAISRKSDDAVVATSANLAGTIAPDHSGVDTALARRSSELAEALLAERELPGGDAWFKGDDWKRLVVGVQEQLSVARSAARADRQEAARLADELQRVQRALELRAEALSSARAEQATGDRTSSQRVAANALRPVVKVLADSFEANSLAAVQESLTATLGRAGIRPIGAVDEVVAFDPRVHRWVGQGVAQDRGLVVSPGFALREEGTEDVVLVPARVVAPPEGAS